ncbi:unnamed protein product [Alopecurus aequalis]
MGDIKDLERILMRHVEPRNLELQCLQEITEYFSEKRKIGAGGFGVVYKGDLQNGISVAVKRITVNEHNLDDVAFNSEVQILMKISHPNIVRFLGFCSNTHQELIKPAGSIESVMAQNRQRLLCFEYISNGNLGKHISDELRGLDWSTRYDIINGICRGLNYLHEKKNIIHMDLNPSNIMIDKYMVPKITDFGLSRPYKYTSITNSHFVTRGYCAPEYVEHGETSKRADIYSLGVIMIELISGRRGFPSSNNNQSNYLDDVMLDIEPLELKFSLELNKEVSWVVKLTNRTNACFAFKIDNPSKMYTIRPDQGILKPKCNECVQITVGAPQATQDGDKFTVWSTKVSESLIVEHITEQTFHEEDGKMIDEVDMMVVYAKPQQNTRSREGTNMTSEEDLQDIGSSSQEQCTAWTEKCNLHTLQSFSRHSRTNNKYLGDKSRAVDSTMGAMGSLLDKLGKLVMENYHLDPSIMEDIESFSKDLRNMHGDLPKLENVDGAKDWVDEVREMSYHIEDMVDCFLVHVEPNNSQSGGFKELKHEGLKLLVNGIPTHRQIHEVIKEIKKKVKAMAERKEMENINVKDVIANTTVQDAIDDLRISAIYNDVEEKLVGIEVPREELISLLKKDADVPKEKLMVVSIFGMGGLGKTTLAKVVYEKLQPQFEISSFVPVGQHADLKTVLNNIITEVNGDSNGGKLIVGQLIKKLKESLKNKRYFIVIDDIWDSSAWDIIKSAFPESKNDSRVIITTRNHDVALACCHPHSEYVYEIKRLSVEDSKRLFFGRAFGFRNDCPDTPRKKEISEYILKRCRGMPLAINSIASRLFCKVDSTWEYVWKCLRAMTEDDGLETTKQILDVSYIHLRDDLKTCMLYFSMYAEDCEIEKNELVRQWVAEGFVSGKGPLDAEDVAENNFKELINMCLLEPEGTDYNNEVLSCRVHDIILDLMRSKSSKLNFTHVIDGSKYVTEACGKIRRVSVQCNNEEDTEIFETVNEGSLSFVRSVLLEETSSVPCSFFSQLLEMKYVRVLHLRDHGSKHFDLTCISGMFLLRYLLICITSTDLKLPDRIDDLQQLETIYIRGGDGAKCPSGIVSLPQLSHLTMKLNREKLPDEIGRLKSLRTLAGDFVCSIDSMKGLGELTNLRTLEIHLCTHDESKEGITESMNALHSSISRLSTCSLSIISLRLDHDLSCWSSTPFPRGSHIRKLDLLYFRFQRCPEWIGHLHELESLRIGVMEVANAVSIVAGLPLLSLFGIYVRGEEEENEESVVIFGGGAFQALKHLVFNCAKASLTFEEGALPKLETLSIQFSHHRDRRFLPAVGIEHLPKLKIIMLTVIAVQDAKNWECMVFPAQPNTPSSLYQFSQEEYDWWCYYHSEQYRVNYIKQIRTLSYLLKRAFKEKHPGANICISFIQQDYDDTSDEEAEYCNEEAVGDALLLMCLPRSLQLCELTSAQLSNLMNILYTKGNRAVGSESRQRGCTENYESVDDEGDHYREGDEESAVQVNGSHTSAQVHATRRQVELIDAPEDSGRMRTNTDAPLTSVNSEGQQSGPTQDWHPCSLLINNFRGLMENLCGLVKR